MEQLLNYGINEASKILVKDLVELGGTIVGSRVILNELYKDNKYVNLEELLVEITSRSDVDIVFIDKIKYDAAMLYLNNKIDNGIVVEELLEFGGVYKKAKTRNIIKRPDVKIDLILSASIFPLCKQWRNWIEYHETEFNKIVELNVFNKAKYGKEIVFPKEFYI